MSGYRLIVSTGLAVLAGSGIFYGKRKISQPKNRSMSLEEAINETKIITESIQRESGSPGLSIAVSVDGKLVLAHGFGWADIENEVPCSPHTVMKLASISKPITSAVLAKIWERSGLDLDENIQNYIPYWPDKSWKGNRVILTVRQLASHQAGIRDYKKINRKNRNPKHSSDSHQEFAYEEYYINDKYNSVKDAVALFKHGELIDKPGSGFHYTTHGYTLLSAALEGITGINFQKLVQNFFKDINMSESYLDFDKQDLIYNRSRHYIKDKDGTLHNAPHTESSFKLAGAGMLSTTIDLIKFANAMLYSYQQSYNTSSQSEQHLPGYLESKTVAMLWTPIEHTHVGWNSQGRYGMGWQIVPFDNIKKNTDICDNGNIRVAVGHTGGTVGASSAMIILPQSNQNLKKIVNEMPDQGVVKGVVVVILANLQGLNLGPVAMDIARIFDKSTV